MKILLAEIQKKCDAWDWEGKYMMDKLGKDHECIFTDKFAQEYEGDLSDIEVLCTFIHSQVKKELIDKMPKLKLVVTRSTGFDHIDTVYCKEKGITACNVPFYGENTVAEYAFALLLTLGRKTYEAKERIIRSNYEIDDLMGFDLKGKTFGVVGGGHIGIHAVKIANGFGMKVLVFDVKPNEQLAKDNNFEYSDLDRLYKEADIISLHVPLIPPTRHMINKEALAKMKDGVVIINTARGGVIDTNALVEALDSGKVAGAGLDVLEEEEFLAEEKSKIGNEKEIEKLRTSLENHILMDHPRVVLTFHNAFNTVEGRTRILDTTLENISGFMGEKVINSVIK